MGFWKKMGWVLAPVVLTKLLDMLDGKYPNGLEWLGAGAVWVWDKLTYTVNMPVLAIGFGVFVLLNLWRDNRQLHFQRVRFESKYHTALMAEKHTVPMRDRSCRRTCSRMLGRSRTRSLSGPCSVPRRIPVPMSPSGRR